LVCYIQKYVIILAGIFPLTSPQPKYWGGCVPGIPGGVDASVEVYVPSDEYCLLSISLCLGGRCDLEFQFPFHFKRCEAYYRYEINK